MSTVNVTIWTSELAPAAATMPAPNAARPIGPRITAVTSSSPAISTAATTNQIAQSGMRAR